MNGDVVAVIEAAYQLEATDARWQQGLLAAAHAVLDRGLGVCAYRFDGSDLRRFHVSGWTEIGVRSSRVRQRSLESLRGLQPEFVERTYMRIPCAQVSRTLETPELRGLLAHLIEPAGAADVMAVNAVDPTGRGVYLGVMLPEGANVAARQVTTWSRIAAHIAAGLRLRRRLRAASNVEARFHPSGHMRDASAEAASARAVLHQAVAALDRARGRLRANAPDEAVRAWKGLVAARWTLVDEFDCLGRRYVLARRNDPRVAAPTALTPREQQAVGWARLGHSNKLIAYEMGISASPVRVLLHRAAARLGVRTREELIAAALGPRP